jgi:hypothetical protein
MLLWTLCFLCHCTVLSNIYSRYTEVSCLGQSQHYVMIDGQPASLSWCQASIWGPRPDFYYCQTVACLLMWGAFCGKRTGLLFTAVADPRQDSHSQVWVQPFLSESELLYDWLFATKSLEADNHSFIFLQLNPCCHSPYATSSLTRGWVCLLRVGFVVSSVHIAHIA